MKQLINDREIKNLVREELSKVVTIDTFNGKPIDWYWSYTEEQKQEYFNNVLDELVISNLCKDYHHHNKARCLVKIANEMFHCSDKWSLEQLLVKQANLKDEDGESIVPIVNFCGEKINIIIDLYIEQRLDKLLKHDNPYTYFDKHHIDIIYEEYTYHLKDILQCIINPKYRLDILIELFTRNYEFDWRLIYLVQHINNTNKIHGVEDIISKAIEEDGDFEKVLNSSKVDNSELLNIIESVVSNMTKEVSEYKSGNKKAIGSILGKIKQQLPKGVDMRTVSEELNNYLK